jgi:aspartate carbamoyltransferase catalytic subunit
VKSLFYKTKEKRIWKMTFKEKFEQGIITCREFEREDIDYIIERAKHLMDVKNSNRLTGKILATLFFEPSTRTRLSFESAMHRLGGNVIGFQSGDVSSIKKGESLADTIRTVENYSDCIVIRHSMEGAARLASKFASIPIINAGSGSGEHPTQALLDLLTISVESGKIDDLTIGIMGDLKFGRTVHSLSILLSRFNVKVYFISPKELMMRRRYKEYLTEQKLDFEEIIKYRDILEELDVLYMTRIQKERFVDLEEYEKVKSFYVFNSDDLEKTKENFRLMHPLPRINEISPDIDNSPKAIYFKQTFYGIPMREALLDELMRD